MSEDTKVSDEENIDQENENVEGSPEELESKIEDLKKEESKLDAIITRKGNIVKDLNEKISEDVPDKEDVNSPTLEERVERNELRTEFGYNDEVIDHVMSLGGRKALDNPITKQVAEEMKNQHNAQQAADIPDGPESSLEKKYTQADLDKMTSSELEKVLPHAEI